MNVRLCIYHKSSDVDLEFVFENIVVCDNMSLIFVANIFNESEQYL